MDHPEAVAAATRAVVVRLRHQYPAVERDELKSAAGFGVAKALDEYNADKSQALLVWLKVAGRQRAIDELRQCGIVDRRGSPGRSGSARRPKQVSQLTDAEADEFVRAASVVDDKHQSDLFGHPCLTDSEKSVLIGRYADHRTWSELAEVLGIPQRTCQRMHEAAIEKLREELEEGEDS